MTPQGFDVSLWQSHAVVQAHLPGSTLAIVKISQDNFIDPAAPAHLAAIKGVDFAGGYHWLGLSISPEDQAALYLRHVPDWVQFHNLDVEGILLASPATHAAFIEAGRRFISAIHFLDHRPILLYSSRGTWPGNLGQDGNWVADYTGDPERLMLRLTRRAIPWVIWQYTSRPIDLDTYKPDALAKLIGRAPVPAPGGTKVKFIQISADDADTLPTLTLPAGTRIEDFAGENWKTIGPTSVRTVPGLVDGHTNRHVVVIDTARFYTDGIQRLTLQVAVLP